jgi:amino acid adenylation domain-containing protein
VAALAAAHGDVQALPVSFAQRRFWMLDQLDEATAAYTLPLALEVTGPLDVPALAHAITLVVARHEALRTVLVLDGEEPMQVVLPAAPVPLPLEDLRALPPDQRAARVQAALDDNANRGFDLARGPLARVALLRTADDVHVWLAAFHHAIADGVSLGLFLDEVAEAYAARVAGRDAQLPALPLQYADFAVWQRKAMQGKGAAAQRAYWSGVLRDPPVLDLATDRARPPVMTAAGAKRTRELPAATVEGMRALARREGATPYAAFLAAFAVLLHRYTQQEDLVVGSITAGRRRAEVERLIGLFLNTLAIRVDAGGAPSFTALLARVRDRVAEALANQDIPFEQVVEAVQPERDRSRSPLFQAAFQLLEGLGEEPALAGCRVRRLGAAKDTAKFDLTLMLQPAAGGGLRAVLEYRTDLFEAATVDRMLAHFGALLDAIVRDPSAPIGALPLMAEAEREAVRTAGNDTARPLPDWTAPARIRAMADAHPDAVAVEGEDGALTYATLMARADQVTARLAALGVAPGARVAVMVERTTSLPVALLGAWGAGAAYVPLDSAYPAARITQVFEDASVAAVIVDAPSATRAAEALGAVSAPVLALDAALWAGAAAPRAVPALGATDVAYAIFTSGSTGRPKGVAVPHGALANFLATMAEAPGLARGDALLAVTTIAFDIAGLELWLPLTTGARVVVASRAMTLDGAALRARLDAMAAAVAPGRAVLQATPATWRLLLEAGWRGAPNVVMLCGGEAWPEGLAAALLPRGGALWNVYGPTETTIWSTRQRVTSPDVHLGEPIANTTLHVLDARGALVPVGVPGELWIGGAGLAVGYVGRDDLTRERFVEHAGLGRLYRTGDRVRRLADGRIAFLGRIDDQVKLRGHRIELGEIEHALAGAAGVAQAVASVQPLGGEPQVVAHLVLAPGADPDAVRAAAIAAARAALPEYMVPRALVVLDALPLTPNGKVNRRALPAPEASLALAAPYVAPRTPTEALVAAIWAEVLGRDRVGADDDFFALGGHSLLAMRVVARVAGACDVPLTIGAMFEAHTVSALAALVEARRAAGAEAAPAAIPGHAGGDAPLGLAQEPLWLFEQLQPGTATYHVPVVRRLVGAVDLGALERALAAVAAAHAALRTAFVEVDGLPRQRVAADAAIPVAVHDLRARPAATRDAERDRLVHEAATRPFDLARAPLARACIVREADDRTVVALVLHHLVCDGASINVLLADWGAAYAQAVAGERPALPPAIGMDDVAAWERAERTDDALEADLAWWREALEGAPAGVDLPTDRPRTAARWGPGARVVRTLPGAAPERVRALAQAQGATPYMVLLAAVHALLHRHSAQVTTVIGTPQAGRDHPELARLVGCRVQTPLVRADVAADTTVASLVAAVRRATLGATAHAQVPSDRLVRALRGRDAAADAALFDILVAVQDGIGAVPAFGPLAVESLGTDVGAAKFDLSLNLVTAGDGYRAVLDYRADLFDAETMGAFLDQLGALLDAACRAPEALVDALPLGDARPAPLAAGPVVAPDGPALLDAAVRDALRLHAGRVAVEQGSERRTGAELAARAAAIAGALASRGVGRGHVVAVLLERSVDLPAALLGILASGAAYLPVDPEYPAERVRFMLDDAAATVVVTTARWRDAVAAPVLLLEEVPAGGAPWPDRDDVRSAEDPAYVLYTSGSTGTPKGVVVPHRAIVNHMRWMARTVPLGADGAVLQKTPVSFDASVWEFWAPLLQGGRLVMAAPGAHRDPVAMVEEVRRAAITDLQLVPSVLATLVEVPAFGGCRSLRRVFAGGEALPTALVRRVLALLDVEVHNLYGPAEATIDATSWQARRGDAIVGDIAPIGRPIDNVRVHVMSPAGAPCPAGVWGELWIAGEGVALGYHRRPELTAERFVRDPFGASTARAYRTGDRVRMRRDGVLEFGGRLDAQVKLHGMRLELGEVEAAILAAGGIAAAAAGLHRDAVRGDRLVAWVVPEPGTALDRPTLLAALAQRLPGPLVPSAIEELPRLPLSPSGKLDRAALPAPRAEVARAPLPPRTDTERLVAGVWAEVLGVEVDHVEVPFTAYGGHSLLAMRVVAKLAPRVPGRLTIGAVFAAPTVAALAAHIDALPRAAAVPALAPRASSGPAPLGWAQEPIWLFEQMNPGTSTYHVPVVRELRGALDVARLRSALEAVVAAHAALRTRFVEHEGVAGQEVLPRVALPWTEHDVRAAGDPAAEARRLVRDAVNAPFDLAAAPLLRAVVVRQHDAHWVVALVVHHLVTDGASMGVILADWEAAYAELAVAPRAAVPAPPIGLDDFAAWERSAVGEAEVEAAVAHWRTALDGVRPGIELPTDQPRGAARWGPQGRAAVTLPPAAVAAVHALAEAAGTTPFVVGLAAFSALLHRYSAQGSIVVGSPVARREPAELERLVGCLVSTVLLRAECGDDPTFATLLARARAAAADALAHPLVPPDRLLRAIGGDVRGALFDVLYTLQDERDRAATFAGCEAVGQPPEMGVAKFDLSLSLAQRPGAMRAVLEFRADLFDAASMERLATHLGTLLAAAGAAPGTPLSRLPLMDDAERTQVVRTWNATAVDYPAGDTLVSLLEAQAARTPDAPAVRDARTTLTYAQLHAAADALAARLRAAGAGAGTRVGICAERSVELVVALVATLKAGAAYVPFDPEYPRDRLAFMVEDAAVAVVIAPAAFVPLVASGAGAPPVVALEGVADVPRGDAPVARTWPAPTPDDAAYMIYTSGSTGRPKGAVNAHRHIVNRLRWMQATFQLTPADVVLQKTPMSFDVSVWEFFWPLLAGARLVLAAPGGHRDPAYLADVIRAEQVSVLHFVPSMLRAFLAAGVAPTAGGTLRAIMASGEALPADLVAQCQAALPQAAVHNLYGPTECAVDVTWWPCPPGLAPSAVVPIGRPIANTQCYVLDAHGAPCPIGVPGELYLAGAQVGLGYHGRPELTAERFVADPFATAPGARMYRTGDRARWRADGTIEYLGRLDFQVKLRGFRIELGEIEAALQAAGGVRESVAVVHVDAAGDQHLVAYVVPTDTTLDLRALVAQLEQRLPAHMVPAVIMPLDAMPLTPSGKLDRRALPAPDFGALAAPSRPPESDLERAVALIWQDVLGRPVEGAETPFAGLGGHSLLATRVTAQLGRIFRTSLSLRRFFAEPTVAGIARALAELEPRPGQSALIASTFLKVRTMTPEERERLKGAAVPSSTTPAS